MGDNLELSKLLHEIAPADENAMKKARERQASLAKPPGSLGVLEEIAIRLSGITGQVHNTVDMGHILICCADHGVTEEGVSVSPVSVTASQAINMTKEVTGVGAIAKTFGIMTIVADIGIATPYACDDVLPLKVRNGTRNLLKEDAMTREETVQAILKGASLVARVCEERNLNEVPLIGAGEMGIGNTTSAAAVLALLTGKKAKDVTGYGGGLTDEMYRHKIAVIEGGICRRAVDTDDVIDVLSAVGGLEIAAMCGVFLAAAAKKCAAVIDGFPSAVAALCAVRLQPEVRTYLFPSHKSEEQGFQIAMEALSLTPYFDLKMRLGEGSGCPFTFGLLRAACAVQNCMATFAEAKINDAYLDVIRKGGAS